MNKKVFCLFLVPFLCSLAVIGSGFSAFVFDINVSSSVNASVEVEDTSDDDEIVSYAKKVNLWFSQKREGDDNSYDFKFTYERNESITMPTERKVSEVEFRPVSIPAGARVKNKAFYMKFFLKTELANYIKQYSWGETAYVKPGIQTSTFLIPDASNEGGLGEGFSYIMVQRSTYVNELDIFDWENLKFEYREGMRPSNITEFNTLKALVNQYGSIAKIEFISNVFYEKT